MPLEVDAAHRAALSAAHVGTWRVEGVTVRWDATLEALHGLDPGKFPGTVEAWFALVHPDDHAVLRDLLGGDDRPPNTGVDLEVRVLWPDSTARWLAVRGETVSDRTARVGATGCAWDITVAKAGQAGTEALLVAERAARSVAEASADRLARLQELTARLARSVDPSEVADIVLGHGVMALGGERGTLCLLTSGGDELEVVAQLGYSGDHSSWARFPLDARLPASHVARTGEAAYMSGRADRDALFPDLRTRPIIDMDSAAAALPLTTAETGPIGGLVIGFSGWRTFSDEDRSFLTAVADQAAIALARTRARSDADARRDQLEYLAEASAAMAESLDLDTTLRRVAELAIPRLSDRAAVYFRTPTDVEGRFLTSGGDEASEVVRTLVQDYPVDMTADIGVGAVLRTGQAEFYPEIDPADMAEAMNSQPEGFRNLMSHVDVGGAHNLPLVARGRVLGVLSLTNRAGRRMSEADRVLGEELAARAGVAIDNARLFEDRARIAHRLQANLLPDTLPRVDGLELAARYRAAGEGLDVGGDFYDAIRTATGWLLVTGDVKGKGVDAAALTGLVRHTIGSAALTHPSPAAILSHLNEVLVIQEAIRASADPDNWEATEPRFATAVLAHLEPVSTGFRVTVSSGGHPLPMVRRADGTIGVVGRPGTLLGAFDETVFRDDEVLLTPGCMLVTYTDGVSEARKAGGFFGDEGVAAVLAACAGSVAEVAAALESASAAGGDVRDDIAILVVEVTGVGPVRDASAAETLRLAPVLASVRMSRQFLGAIVDRSGAADGIADVARLLVSELTTNAVIHAATGIWLDAAVVDGTLVVGVRDLSPALPDIGKAGPTDVSGRGLALVAMLADHWGVDKLADGKRVWFELSISGDDEG